MRSPRDADVFVVDLTNRCHLACGNCTRLVSMQTETKEMSVETFRKALHSLKAWYRPGCVIGLIGGEPTLNRNFAEIARVFKEEFGGETNGPRGIVPIADYNAYANERLFDRSSGRGLWTSLGGKFYEHAETIHDVFDHWNTNTHEAGGVHQTGLVDAREMCEALGIPWEDFPKYRDRCWVNQMWSPSITPEGKGYFCEFGAQIDTLFNDGKLGWDTSDPRWWDKSPDQFGDQLSICEKCSMCLPGPSVVDAANRDIVGKEYRIRLETINSPAIRKGRCDTFDPKVHTEQRTIDRKDNYAADYRVAPDHRSPFPRKLSAVVVCVGRGEQLRQTLAHNAGQVDELVVVTDSHPGEVGLPAVHRMIDDVFATGAIPDGRVTIRTTNRCFDDGHAFNKGRMLNDGLKALAPDADWVVLTDADVFLPDNLREYVRTHALNPGVLYGAKRDNGTPGLAAVNDAPNGYFQLFNRRALAIRDRWPAVMSEEFCSAGGIDTWFMQQFPPGKRYVIPELSVRHLEHGDGLGAGWNGTADGPRWRQVGMFTAHAGLIPVAGAVLNAASRFRLVDTLRGEVWEGEIPESGQLPGDVLMRHEGGLAFKGKDIGTAHVHVAMWG